MSNADSRRRRRRPALLRPSPTRKLAVRAIAASPWRMARRSACQTRTRRYRCPLRGIGHGGRCTARRGNGSSAWACGALQWEEEFRRKAAAAERLAAKEKEMKKAAKVC